MRFDFVYTTLPEEHKFSHRIGLGVFQARVALDGTTSEAFLARTDVFLIRPGTPQMERYLQECDYSPASYGSYTFYSLQMSRTSENPPNGTDNRLRSVQGGGNGETYILGIIRDQLWFGLEGNIGNGSRRELEGVLFGTAPSSDWIGSNGWRWDFIEEVLPGFLQLCADDSHPDTNNSQRCVFRFDDGHPVCIHPDCEESGVYNYSVDLTPEGTRGAHWVCENHEADWLEYCQDCGWRFLPGSTHDAAEWLADTLEEITTSTVEPLPEDLTAESAVIALGWSSLQQLSGRRWCEPCAESVLDRLGDSIDGIECDGCGDWSFVAAWDERHFCAPCDRENHRWAVLNYSFKPQPIFHPEIPDDPRLLYHGFEFEVAGMGHSAACRWATKEKLSPELFYMKSDSSVARGTEVVTHPFSYEWAINNFPFASFDTAVAEYGAKETHESAGTHIHVSKASFSRAHMFKFLQLHFRLPSLLQTLGGRGDVGYARWQLNPVRDAAKRIAMKRNVPIGRLAVNVNPAHTIELRYPASGFSARLARKNIELPNALYQFSAEISIQNVKDGVIDKPGTFIWWLQQEREQFPTLTEYMEEHILVPTAYERSN